LEIVIGLAETDCRGWLADFARDLETAGYSPFFDIRPAPAAQDRLASIALAIENRLYGAQRACWLPLSPDNLPRIAAFDMSGWTLDLSGIAGGQASLSLSLGRDGTLANLPDFLFASNWPAIWIQRADGSLAARGLPSVEGPEIVLNGLREITRRISTLVLMALDNRERPAIEPVEAARSSGAFAPLIFVGRNFVRKLAEKAMPSRLRADHWRTGIRVAQPLDSERLQTSDGFRWLADDGARFFADPVLWEEKGRTFLFVEELPYSTGRGIIAYTELDEHGMPRFPPKPIVERATHLSYPYLFLHDGAIYMIPENAAEKHLPLYRARRFPDDWEEMSPLITGQELHDATLFEHDGRWWLLANAAPHGRASWDCLVAFHAPSPLGPYSPHALNPILVDARHARCGGPLLRIDERLIRPVQNCLGGYGRKLHFVEIEELTPTRFRQKRLGEFAPLAGTWMRGIHTYGRTEKLEVIDALFPRDLR